MSAAPPAYRQHGYILIYAMAVLLFLVATLTGAAYALRLNAQENHQQHVGSPQASLLCSQGSWNVAGVRTLAA